MTSNKVTVSQVSDVTTVKVTTAGPQGPAFPDGDIGDIVISGGGTTATIDNGVINNAKIASDAAIALSKLATGALPTGITVASANIPDLTIVNSDISASAAISLSKLATGALPTAITVTSANISDLSILNADVNASAAIAGTKISPDFGSQNIVTTGNITVGGTVDGVDIAALNTAAARKDGTNMGATTLRVDDADFVVKDDTDGTTNFIWRYHSGSKLYLGSDAAVVTIRSHFEAGSDSTFNIGSSTVRFANIYGDNIHGDGSNLTSLSAGQLTGTIAAARLDTATTQSASDNSTKIATTAYTDTAIANLVDSSPSALNTLNELAAALGDDANFSTTVTNSIATKLPLAGGTLTGNLELDGDFWLDASGTASRDVFWDSSESIFRFYNSAKATFGNNDNLQVYHTGDHAFIENTTGTLVLNTKNDTGDVKIGVGATPSTKLTIASDGNATFAGNVGIGADPGSNALHIENGDMRIEKDTKATIGFRGHTSGSTALAFRDSNAGVDRFTINADGSTTFAGNITTNGDNSFNGADYNSWWDKSDSAFKFDDNAKLKVGTGSDLQIYHDGSNSWINNSTGSLFFKTSRFEAANAAGNEALINCMENGVVELFYDGSKKFETYSSGVQVTGTLFIPDGGSATNRISIGDSGDLKLYHNGSHSYLEESGTGNFYIRSSNTRMQSSAGEDQILLAEDGAVELYYDGAKRFHTTAGGAYVTGTLDTTGTITGGGHIKTGSDTGYFLAGASNDLQLYHDGTESWIKDVGTGDLNICASDLQIKTSDDSEFYMTAVANGAVELYYDGSQKLKTRSDGIGISSDTDAFFLGGDDDLKVFHNNGNPLIASQTGVLYLQSNSHISLRTTGGSDKQAIFCNIHGSVDLYHNNSKKFETTSDGAKVTGKIESAVGSTNVALQVERTGTANGKYGFKLLNDSGNDCSLLLRDEKADATRLTFSSAGNATFGGNVGLADSDKIKLGDGSDLELVHDGTDSFIGHTLGSGLFRLNAAAGSEIRLTKSGPETLARFIPDGAVELMYDNSKKAQTYADGLNVIGDFWIDNQVNAGRDVWFDESADTFKFYTNVKATFGTGNELQIYHDGSNSYIKDAGTGELRFISNTYKFYNAAFSETLIEAFENGAVNLYYDNSKKFETTSAGVTVTGDVSLTSSNTVTAGSFVSTNTSTAFTAVDGAVAYFGTGLDLRVYHDGSNSYINNSTNNLFIRSDNISLYQLTESEPYITCSANGAVNLYYDNSLKIKTTSAGVQMPSGTYFQFDAASSHAWAIGATDGADLPANSGTALQFHYWNNSAWDKISYQSADGIGVPDGKKFIAGDSSDLQIYHDGSNSFIKEPNSVAGQLVIDGYNGTDIRQGSTGEYIIRAIGGGAVELYYDNSLKFNVDSVGAVMGGRLHFPDDIKATFGGAPDFKIYHDSSSGQSIIEESGPSVLKIKGSDLRLSNSANSADYIQANDGGAVKLFYDGGAAKFETTSAGATVTGLLLSQRSTSGAGLVVENTNTGNVYSELAFKNNISGTQATTAELKAKYGSDSEKSKLEFSIRSSNALTTALTLDHDKVAHFAGDVKVLTGDIQMGNGRGISFSATSDAGGMTSETFDDYEEGTWTPTIASGGWTSLGASAVGHYTKIGNIVHVSIANGALTGTGDSNTLSIGGLPFGAANWTPGSMYAQAYNSEGTEQATIAVNGDVGSNTVLRVVEWGNEAIGTDFGAGYFVIQVTYRTT